MPTVVNLYAAKTQLSQLVERAASGEEIIIAKAGKPRARLVPIETKRRKRRKPGGWKGRLWIAKDFDELPESLLDSFEGKDDDA